MSIPDSLILRYFELLTDISTEQLNDYKKGIEAGNNPRDYKMALARTIIAEYYSVEEAKMAEDEFINIFQKKGIPDDMEEIKVQENAPLIDFLFESNFTSSKGEAKRVIQGGGVRIDNEKVINLAQKITFDGKDSLILQVGKRKFAKLIQI